jgi:prepilin-type N-terminal cleavage/methylation domain-containing protein
MLKSRIQQDNCRTQKRGSNVAERAKNRVAVRSEKGFALLEVLAAIVILSIVSLVLTSYFSNALSYANTNQNKTVMVNLARNALFYVEKQDFKKMEKYFNSIVVGVPDTLTGDHPNISIEQCYTDPSNLTTGCSQLFNPSEVLLLSNVLNPTINGVVYNITISYQDLLHKTMLYPEGMTADEAKRKKAMAAYLLPVKVTVSTGAGTVSQSNETVVEGYITDDKIR